MIISVYSAKGSAGKTPISANIALDKNFCIGTNEAFHVYDDFFGEASKNRLISVATEKPFPIEGIKKHKIDIVFDLAGSISKTAVSISSAISASDVVIVPIYNEYKSLFGGLNTINQVQGLNENIIVVATKLQKQKGEKFKRDWAKCADFQNVQSSVHEKFGDSIPILPLKFSKVFDNIFEGRKSIQQLMQGSPLLRYSYKEVALQFDEIYKLMEI